MGDGNWAMGIRNLKKIKAVGYACCFFVKPITLNGI
jgi:hypothetical protein